MTLLPNDLIPLLDGEDGIVERRLIELIREDTEAAEKAERNLAALERKVKNLQRRIKAYEITLADLRKRRALANELIAETKVAK